MLEYYRDAEKTAEAMHDGWYHTGDTAWCDEDGYFWYVGRNDDVIKSSGYRIGPFEIESGASGARGGARVRGHAACPTPMRGTGREGHRSCWPRASQGRDELTRELQTWVKTHTAPYKYPRIVEYVDEPAQDRERQDPPRRHPPGGRRSPKTPEGLV